MLASKEVSKNTNYDELGFMGHVGLITLNSSTHSSQWGHKPKGKDTFTPLVYSLV